MRLTHLFGGILLLALLLSIFLLTPTSRASDDGCVEILVNGDMEGYAGWTIHQGEYSADQYLSPARSAFLGILDGGNAHTESMMHQDIDIPAGNHLALSWHMRPSSAPFDSEDLQQVSVRDSQFTTLRRVWSGVRADEAWMSCSFDLSEFLDQPINLYFGVRNDGDGGKTAMYVDDVSLKVCQSPPVTLNGCLPSTPTPTPTATLTPTPSPTPTLTPTATPTQVMIYFPLIKRF